MSAMIEIEVHTTGAQEVSHGVATLREGEQIAGK